MEKKQFVKKIKPISQGPQFSVPKSLNYSTQAENGKQTADVVNRLSAAGYFTQQRQKDKAVALSRKSLRQLQRHDVISWFTHKQPTMWCNSAQCDAILHFPQKEELILTRNQQPVHV